MPKYDAIFFSPHFDDAILSAGNCIQSLAKRGKKTLIITIFTRGSKTKQTASTQFLKNCDYSSANMLFRDRAKEDIQAAAIVGCDYHHLNYVDAGFRKDHPTFNTIFNGTPTKDDLLILKKIADSLRMLIGTHAKNDAQLFFPLGVGKHIDHHLVFLAANMLWNPNTSHRLFFWEDIPYRNQAGSTIQRLTAINSTVSGMNTEIVASSGAVKHRALMAYSSQMTGLNQIGGFSMPYDLKIERFWHG